MTIVLIDNGSLEPAAQKTLRCVASGISLHTGERVEAVSWKHSDRIDPAKLDGVRAWTIARFLAAKLEAGEREFLFIPFFVSEQGAIGSALREDLELLKVELGGFSYRFTQGLSAMNALVPIVASRIRAELKAHPKASVLVVDHGGPSPRSAELRDRVASELRQELGAEIGPLLASSMEGSEHPFNHPLFSEVLSGSSLPAGAVVVAPLFLAPGRHAGPAGDLVRLAGEALRPGLTCVFAGLVGSHELATSALAQALRDALPLPLIV